MLSDQEGERWVPRRRFIRQKGTCFGIFAAEQMSPREGEQDEHPDRQIAAQAEGSECTPVRRDNDEERQHDQHRAAFCRAAERRGARLGRQRRTSMPTPTGNTMVPSTLPAMATGETDALKPNALPSKTRVTGVVTSAAKRSTR